jgi:hypothetical protein
MVNTVSSNSKITKVETMIDHNGKGETGRYLHCSYTHDLEGEATDMDVKPLEEPRNLSSDPSRPASLYGDVTATALINQLAEGEETLFAIDDSSVKPNFSTPSGEKPSRDFREELPDNVQESFAEVRVRLPEEACQTAIEMEEPPTAQSAISAADDPLTNSQPTEHATPLEPTKSTDTSRSS